MQRGFHRRSVWIAVVFTMLAVACSGSEVADQTDPPPVARPTSDRSEATSATAAEQIACAQFPPDERPAAAVFMMAFCGSELLDEEQRACTADRAVALAAEPVAVDVAADRYPPLEISAERSDELVPVEVVEIVAAVAGVSGVVPSVVSFDVLVADDQGLRVGPAPSGAPLLTTNWGSFRAVEMSGGAAPPGPGEFALNDAAALDAGLEVGVAYEVLTGVGQESFVYVGEFESQFEGSHFVALADDDAFRFLKDGLGYNTVGVWTDNDAVASLVQQAIADLPGLLVDRPGERAAEEFAAITDQARASAAIVMCMVPEARIAAVSALSQRGVDLPTADCLLNEHAVDPFDDELFRHEAGC